MSDQTDADLKYRSDVKICPHCEKYILVSNFTMHELHCSKINRKVAGAEGGGGAIGGTAAKSDTSAAAKDRKKPNEKIKKNPVEAAQTDDFDELVEMFQKSNNVCNFKGCKVLVKTLGQNCEFCRNRFCLNHSLAEV